MRKYRPRQLVGYLCTLLLVSSPLASSLRAEILGGDFKFNGVFRFDDNGAPILSNAIPSNSAGLHGTAGVEIGPDGNIYVSSKDTGEILFYSALTGAPLPSPLSGGRDGLFAVLRDANHPNSGPGPLRFGPDGNLYVADYGGTTIREYNGTSGLEMPVVATGFGPPAGLTFAPDGDLYASNFGTGAVIRIHNGQKSTFIASGTGPILTPSSLLFVPNGDLLVVSMFANEIHRYSSTGAYLGLFAEIPPTPDPNIGDTNYPSDIAFDADGNVLVAVLGQTNPPDNRGQILRYKIEDGSIAGTLLDTVVSGSPPIGSVAWVRSPNAIAGDYDSNGTTGAGDYARWRADFGKYVAKGGGPDGSGDGVVDACDYVLWRKALGGGSNLAFQSALPEPLAVVILLTAAIPLLASRIKRVRS